MFPVLMSAIDYRFVTQDIRVKRFWSRKFCIAPIGTKYKRVLLNELKSRRRSRALKQYVNSEHLVVLSCLPSQRPSRKLFFSLQCQVNCGKTDVVKCRCSFRKIILFKIEVGKCRKTFLLFRKSTFSVAFSSYNSILKNIRSISQKSKFLKTAASKFLYTMRTQCCMFYSLYR